LRYGATLVSYNLIADNFYTPSPPGVPSDPLHGRWRAGQDHQRDARTDGKGGTYNVG
jgi:hypothetical protein